MIFYKTIKFFQSKGIDINRYKMASMRTNAFLEFLVPHLRIANFPEDEMGKKAVKILMNHIDDSRKGSEWVNRSVVLNCSFL